MLARRVQQCRVNMLTQRLGIRTENKECCSANCMQLRGATLVARAAVPGEAPHDQYGLVQDAPTYGLQDQEQYGQYGSKQLSAGDEDELEGQPNAPPGMALYETLLVMQPELTDEERDQELARFESFLISVRIS
jgi:hypothetical protein